MLVQFFYLLATAALSAFVKAQDDAWHLDYIYVLGNEEIDPIVSPNQQSSHMHKIIGGSRMAAYYNYNDYVGASCSSLRVQADKSNYWMPNLYIIDKESGNFVSVPAHIRFYYFLGRNSPYQNVRAFPKGLRILTGNPNNKSPTSIAQFTCQVNQDFSNSLVANSFNFNRDCPYGMKTELFFPPCWDGVNLYKGDGSHMAWPDNGVRDGSCPWDHPVRLPAIQLEYTWQTSNYNPGMPLSGNLAWANGDTTGYGVHGDFVMGWTEGVLDVALNDTRCVNLGQAIAMTDCPSLNQYSDDAKARACRPEKGVLVEPTGNGDLTPISALPGCNPLWGSGAKPGCNPAVAGLDVSKLTGADGPYIASADDRRDFVYPTTPGWHNIACMKEASAITGGVSYTDSAMTVESCTATCLASGYNFAATGQVGAWNCVCGTQMRTNAGVYPGMCGTKCPGNSTQDCGGSYIFNVWYAPEGTIPDEMTLADGSQYVGCYNNPSTASNGLLGQATYNFQSQTMTTETCIAACGHLNTNWALTTSAKWCYCGNNWNFGQGALVPQSYCTVKCTGNSSEVCGDYYRSSVYNITTAVIANSTTYHPPGWQGCYQDLSGHLALTNNSWTSNTMTPMECINGCSELGYTYAGVEAGKTCYCGSQVASGTTRLPTSQCGLACAGNSTAVCGGNSAMDLYTVTAATNTPATQQASHPAGYVGCFLDSGSNLAFANYYSYTINPMSVNICKQSCGEMGYAFAGVENGNQCRCGNNFPKTTQYVSGLYCKTPCSGNSSQTCGAGGYMDAYSLANTTAAVAMPGISADDYLGCYDNSNRGLTAYQYYANTMTVEVCRNTCHEMGYALASVFLSKYCGCGNAWTGSQTKLPASACQTYGCGGNYTEYCGGSSQAALYNTTEPASATTVVKPDGWISCWTDSSSSRTLQGYSYNASPMSANACKIACAAKGFAYAGTESGNQCFCGSTIAAGEKAPTSACSYGCNGNANQTCGASGYMDLYNTTGAAANNGIAGYAGCYTDDGVLGGPSYVSNFMSVDTCTQWCTAQKQSFAGIRNGNQCKCGTNSPSLATTSAACANPCSGNSTQACGTSTTIAVYNLAQTGLKSGDIPLVADSTGYAGCYHEGSTRLLPTYYFSSSSMTNALCINNCKSLGYAVAGTEYGGQCFCAAKPDASSGGYKVQNSDCTSNCAGGGTLKCGGGNLLSIYFTSNSASAGGSNSTNSTTPSTGTGTGSQIEGYKGCYQLGTFPQAPPLTYYGGFMTADLCRRSCRNGGYSIAGLTNANTCICGNNPTYGAANAPATCNAPCAGNTTQTCGGQFSAALSVYDTTGAGSQTPAGFPANYVGCVNDASTRVLPNYSFTNNGMTSDMCRKVCVAAGYKNYGTEAGSQCWCGTNKVVAGILPDSQCNSKCPGNQAEFCGAGGKLSYYNIAAAVTTPNATTSVTTTAAASASASASVSKASSSVAASVSASVSKPASSSAAAASSSASASKAASSAAAVSSSTSKVASAVTAPATSSAKPSSAASSSSIKPSTVTAPVTSTSASAARSSAPASVAASSSSSKAVSGASSPGVGQIATGGAASVSGTKSATPSVVTAASTSVASSKAASSITAASTSSSKPAASTMTSTTTVKSSAATSSTTTSTAAIPTGTSLGCYTGSSTAFNSAVMTGHDNLTPAMCQIWCNANYYTYSGLSGGNTCGCSNTMTGLTSAGLSTCSTNCSGDSSLKCGGTANNNYSVFRATAAVKPAKRFDSSSASQARRDREGRRAKTVHAAVERDAASGSRRRGGRGIFANW
ncbi:hypothetical protein CI109_104979 [Kwoniella shandongensis]|uniref:Uncharacterized protein n=1 Tax=Kwoniella shandongensis TaxID=1734106 RepID=A0A5M6BSL4_9TREE|nr:uncharacterized protein CI109_006694 [Kwoniella shandongensis]KAA5524970.1 hypothetical protein CI109_006694 [Kwoniella shandongensis]